MRGAPALFLALALVAGCAEHSYRGYFDDHAYYATRQHYRMRYLADAAPQHALLGPDWRPLDFVLRSGVAVSVRPDRTSTDRVYVDLNDDGIGDGWAPVDRFDMRFEHRQTGALILVRTSPLGRAAVDRGLDVLVHETIEELGRAAPRGYGTAVEVVRTSYESAATVGGAPAYQAMFEGAALGQGGTVVATSTDRAFLVMVRPPGRWTVVTFWLVARREHFDSLVGDFRSLLGRTDFRVRNLGAEP